MGGKIFLNEDMGFHTSMTVPAIYYMMMKMEGEIRGL